LRPIKQSRQPNVRVTAKASSESITLQAGAVRAVFDRSTGILTEFGADSNIIESGPMLNVWRAATDNDGLKLLLDKEPDQVLHRWLDLGLHQLAYSLQHVRLIRGDELPVVEIVQHASGRKRWSDFLHTQRYTLLHSGDLQVENSVRLARDIRDLPRVGVSLTLIPGLTHLGWFGRGPWENYSDRKASAMVGRYVSTVAEQYVPYILPQEHGHKTDVRWLTLTNAQGEGLRVDGEPTVEFSASHYTDADLFAAKHTNDLSPRPEVILNLDAAMRGLGTASCGPDALDAHRLLASTYHFVYRLRLTGKAH
jgi:beta-galactosidase